MALALERWTRGGLWVIARGDPAFPRRLKQRFRHRAPALLYGAGDPALLETGGMAIVGSRDASASALEFTRHVASRCAKAGMTVVSGGARGVDAAAMQGATQAGGRCIGVLAADLLKASVNRHNRVGIREGRLVLVSPFPPEAGFHAGHAMGRNRYIYALADLALVVDAGLRTGGTWAGAVENLRQGWVPMYVRSPGEGAGNAALIAQGARPFTAEDASRDPLASPLERRQRGQVRRLCVQAACGARRWPVDGGRPCARPAPREGPGQGLAEAGVRDRRGGEAEAASALRPGPSGQAVLIAGHARTDHRQGP
jgi:predicted Rossmann fold nucleotide-binding protein DprA/Smf involved in DNA uptake